MDVFLAGRLVRWCANAYDDEDIFYYLGAVLQGQGESDAVNQGLPHLCIYVSIYPSLSLFLSICVFLPYIYLYISRYFQLSVSWWHPASKHLLRLEAGYPALRCHILEEEHTSAT